MSFFAARKLTVQERAISTFSTSRVSGVISLFLALAISPLIFAASRSSAFDRGGVSVDFRNLKQIDHSPDSVTLAVLPFSFFEDSYYLPSGQVGILQLTARNFASREFQAPKIVLTLPEQIHLLGLRNGSKSLQKKRTVEKDGEKFVEYHISYSMPRQIKEDRYNQSYGEFILLQADLPPSEKKYPAECYFADGDFTGETRPFTIRIMEPVHGKQPKFFKTGAHVWHEFTYAEEAALKKLAEYYVGAGFNVIQLGTASSTEMSAAFKNVGVYRYIQRFMTNGYTLSENQVGEKLPDVAKYRAIDGSHVGNAICPNEIYRRGEYYTQFMEPAFRTAIVGDDLAESLMCNWEPFMFVNNGCFCDRCMEEFITHTGLPRAEIQQAWPAKVVRNYGSQWSQFRSWQHAQLLLTLERSLSTIGKEAGKESHFIPEIGNSFRRGDWPRSQYDPRDYMEKLPIIEAWGPYIYQRFTRPYVYTLDKQLSLYRRAVETVAFLESSVRSDNQPEVIAFPQGIQSDWIQEPEAIAFQTLSFFISGWNGAIGYFFPGGYDGRYFRAMAEANTLIADHEEVVFKGSRKSAENRFRMQVLSPLPELKGPVKNGVEQTLLQSQEYVYGDKHLFAVGNFWQHGDVWVKIVASDLPDRNSFVLREVSHNRVFTNSIGSEKLNARDLKEGVAVHVGALRWAFFTLEPWRQDVNHGQKVTASELNAALSEFRPQLTERLRADSELAAEQHARTEAPDLSHFSAMTNGQISCRLEEKNDKKGQLVVFQLPEANFVIDPSAGAEIISWQYKSIDIVAPKLSIARDGLMLPSPPFVKGPYQLLRQKKEDEGLSITFRKELTSAEYGYELGGVVLEKTYTIYSDSSGFDVATEVRNKSQQEVSLAFRYWNTPAFIADGEHCAWSAEMRGMQETPLQLDSDRGVVEFFRYKKAAHKGIDGVVGNRKTHAISSPEIDLKWPRKSFSVEIDHPGQSGHSLYGIMLWGFTMDENPYSTVEPLFDEVALAQGQSWTARMRWRIKL